MEEQHIVVIGNGGREVALVSKLYCYLPARCYGNVIIDVLPGNGGTRLMEFNGFMVRNHNIKADDISGIAKFAIENKAILTFVGPEAPLVAGLVDILEKAGLAVFGPRAEQAIEGSKVKQKELMDWATPKIPTAGYEVFTDYEAATYYARKANRPLVVKADGLCGGKGVKICHTIKEAKAVLHDFMVKKIHGKAGETVLIEDLLEGGNDNEISVLTFCNGKGDFVILPIIQDHKPVFDGNKGDNTGGMGAWGPVIWANEYIPFIRERIIEPMLGVLSEGGTHFKGCLYAGLMIAPGGPKVVEWNVRPGCPEFQVVLELLESDVLKLIMACAKGERIPEVKLKQGFSVCTVLAAEGYPQKPRLGDIVTGIDEARKIFGSRVIHAGTVLDENRKIRTAGGRVLNAIGNGDTLYQAMERSVAAAKLIEFSGKHFRKDIGAAGLKRLQG